MNAVLGKTLSTDTPLVALTTASDPALTHNAYTNRRLTTMPEGVI